MVFQSGACSIAWSVHILVDEKAESLSRNRAGVGMANN